MVDSSPSSGSRSFRFPSESPEGLNLAEGLERCMNDDSFYSSLLSEFRRSFRESPRKIEVMMDSGNWKEAEMLAHSLKGTAGMVSAIHVAAAASELDVDLKIARNTGVPPGTIREKLHLVKQAMAHLMDTLNTLNIQD